MTKLHETTAEHCSACARLTKRSSRWGCLECSPTPKGACENCRTTANVRWFPSRGARGLNLCGECEGIQ